MTKANKKGFNLIEIAIVLAVIGLVIGGIYVAASSVTDNQRKQKAQSQLVQIVQNIRTAYANQATPAAATTAIPADTLINARIVPADMQSTGTNTVAGAYGNVTVSTAGNTFLVQLDNVNPGACIDFLVKNFGNVAQVNQIGLTTVTVGGTAATPPIDLATANTRCGTAASTMVFTFTLRT